MISIILKVAHIQPFYDHYKHEFYKPKDGLNKNKSTSFASVLENEVRSQYTKKQLNRQAVANIKAPSCPPNW